MNASQIVALILFCAVAWGWLYVNYRKRFRDHPPYDGSAVVGTLPDYQPVITPERDGGGRFVAGHAPIGVKRGAGGRFVSAKTA